MNNGMGFQKKHFDAVAKIVQKPRRIESIKEDVNGMPESWYFKEDAICLLQRLERYEEALNAIAYGCVDADYPVVRQFAKEALREEDIRDE